MVNLATIRCAYSPIPRAISAAQIITPDRQCSSHTISLRVEDHEAVSGNAPPAFRARDQRINRIVGTTDNKAVAANNAIFIQNTGLPV